MKSFGRLLLASWLALVAAAAHAAFLPETYPVIDLLAYPGASGDGTTDNAVPLQQAFNAAVNGGMIRIPCGVFRSTARPTMTLAAGKHLRIVGSGVDCTELYMINANGPIITKADQYASIDVEDLSITTDQGSGALTCLDLTQTVPDIVPAYAATSTVNRVSCRGHDAYGAGAEYWGVGLGLFNVSNVNSFAYVYRGVSQQGRAISIVGDQSDGTYSGGHNFHSPVISLCEDGMYFGDWVQGVTITSGAIIGCANGVLTGNGDSPTSDVLGQLSMVNTRINFLNCGVCVNSIYFNNLQLVNNTFITTYDAGISTNPIAVQVLGTGFNVASNSFGGPGSSHGVGILMGSCYGNGGIVNDNNIAAYNVGIQIVPSFSCQAAIRANVFSTNTADYTVDASATGRAEIDDGQTRTYAAIPPCNSVVEKSRFMMGNSTTTTFYAVISGGGGSSLVQAICDGTDLRVH